MKGEEVQILLKETVISGLLSKRGRNQQRLQQSKGHYRIKDITESQTDSIVFEIYQFLPASNEQNGQKEKMPY